MVKWMVQRRKESIGRVAMSGRKGRAETVRSKGGGECPPHGGGDPFQPCRG